MGYYDVPFWKNYKEERISGGPFGKDYIRRTIDDRVETYEASNGLIPSEPKLVAVEKEMAFGGTHVEDALGNSLGDYYGSRQDKLHDAYHWNNHLQPQIDYNSDRHSKAAAKAAEAETGIATSSGYSGGYGVGYTGSYAPTSSDDSGMEALKTLGLVLLLIVLAPIAILFWIMDS